MDPAIQQIVLTDAPSVLGWEQWHEIDSRYGLGLITTALQVAMDAGYIEPQPVEPLSHLVLGALNEAGLAIARAADPTKTRAQIGTSVTRLIEGLKPRS